MNSTGRLAFVALLLFATSCASGSVPPPAPVSLPPDGTSYTAYACGMRMLNELDYVVIDADRSAGFLRAERNASGWSDALASTQSFDVLTITLYESEGGSLMLRVATTGYQVATRGNDTGGRVAIRPSGRAREHARMILEACGEQISQV